MGPSWAPWGVEQRPSAHSGQEHPPPRRSWQPQLRPDAPPAGPPGAEHQSGTRVASSSASPPASSAFRGPSRSCWQPGMLPGHGGGLSGGRTGRLPRRGSEERRSRGRGSAHSAGVGGHRGRGEEGTGPVSSSSPRPSLCLCEVVPGAKDQGGSPPDCFVYEALPRASCGFPNDPLVA